MTRDNKTQQNSRKKVRLKRMQSSRKIKQDVKSKMREQDVAPSTSVRKSKKKKRNIFGAVIGTMFKVLFFTIIAGGIIAAGVVFGVLSSIVGDTEALNIDTLKSLKLTTFIYDSEGKEIETLSSENRIMVEYEDLPKHVIDAVISIEDERFLTHNGIDIKRTGKAIIEYVLHGGSSSFGGSTITQQLVKNLTQDKSKSWQRKIREWYRAILLEQELEKDDIITGYLNVIYMGEGAYGVEAASNTLFAKSVSDVSIAEAACLAAIIQSPEVYNPYNGEENKQYLLDRQKVVLAKMLELGKITQEEYDKAKAEEIVFKKSDSNQTVTSYFVDAVIEAVVADIQEKNGVEYGVALNMIYNNGYKIYTTQLSSLQATIDKVYSDTKLFTTDSKGRKLQSSMVIIDNETGYVVGVAGGTDKKTKTLGFNRATQMLRQSGSAIKPLSAYGPAFEKGISYPGDGIDDKYIKLGSWAPQNVTKVYLGFVSVRTAIVESINTCAVRTVMEVGLDYAYNFAKSTGLTTLNSQDKNYAALGLGAQDKGVKVLDMAAAYASIARGGVYVEPQFYTKVEDSNGNVVLTTEPEYKRVMKATTAYLLTDCMRSTVTQGYAASSLTSIKKSIQLAGKTGTTDSYNDRWMCGFTPYYTAAVWTGYDDNSRSVSGTPNLKAFNRVMGQLHSSLPAASFKKPSGIVTAQVCTLSGLVATDACKLDTRGVVKNEIFASGTVPTDVCTVHVAATVCEESGNLPTEYCHEYCNLVQKAYVVRDVIPEKKTSDWAYMLFEETPVCALHTESKPIEDPEGEGTEGPENPGDGTTDIPAGPGGEGSGSDNETGGDLEGGTNSGNTENPGTGEGSGGTNNLPVVTQ